MKKFLFESLQNVSKVVGKRTAVAFLFPTPLLIRLLIDIHKQHPVLSLFFGDLLIEGERGGSGGGDERFEFGRRDDLSFGA